MKEIVLKTIGVALGATFFLFILQKTLPAIFLEINLGLTAVAGYSILFFLIFMKGLALSTHQNKNKFTNLIILSILLKILTSFILIFVFYKLYSPQSPDFLIPFFVVYIIYTTFGVNFLSKLGKLKKDEG